MHGIEAPKTLALKGIGLYFRKPSPVVPSYMLKRKVQSMQRQEAALNGSSRVVSNRVESGD